MSMQEDSELEMTIECIRFAVEEIEGMPGNEAVSRMRELFDSIVSQYRDHAGMQAIMLSMAMGDIRHMDSSESGSLFDTWDEWTTENGLQPGQVSRQKVREASKRVWGREDAFIYRAEGDIIG